MPKREFFAGQYYHLYNRGNAREPIFFEPENYRFFLTRLRHQLADKVVDIVAYCLMPNHYHLLVYPRQGNLSAAMHSLGMGYAKAINARYKRYGHLFQGVFQDKRVTTTPQLLHLSRYIPLNPVVAGMVRQPEAWEYSSYCEYVGKRQGTLPKPGAVLEHFDSAASYQSFVEESQLAPTDLIDNLLFD